MLPLKCCQIAKYKVNAIDRYVVNITVSKSNGVRYCTRVYYTDCSMWGHGANDVNILRNYT